jgi:hypothetical protein
VTLCFTALTVPLVQVSAAHRAQTAATLFADGPHGQGQIDLLSNNVAKVYRIPFDKINLHIFVEQFDFLLIRSLLWNNQVDLELRFHFPAERFETTVTSDANPPADRATNKDFVDGFGNPCPDTKGTVQTQDLIVTRSRLPPAFSQHLTEFCLFGDRLKIDDHRKNPLRNDFNKSN